MMLARLARLPLRLGCPYKLNSKHIEYSNWPGSAPGGNSGEAIQDGLMKKAIDRNFAMQRSHIC